MFKTYGYLMRSLRGYKKDVILTWAFVIIETFCEILVPFFMQFLIDSMKLTFDTSTDWSSYFATFSQKYGPLMQGIVSGIHSSAGSYDVYVYGGIMVIDQGRIIERGSHDELMAKKGKYYQLYTGNAIAEN